MDQNHFDTDAKHYKKKNTLDYIAIAFLCVFIDTLNDSKRNKRLGKIQVTSSI